MGTEENTKEKKRKLKVGKDVERINRPDLFDFNENEMQKRRLKKNKGVQEKNK